MGGCLVLLIFGKTCSLLHFHNVRRGFDFFWRISLESEQGDSVEIRQIWKNRAYFGFSEKDKISLYVFFEPAS